MRKCIIVLDFGDISPDASKVQLMLKYFEETSLKYSGD